MTRTMNGHEVIYSDDPHALDKLHQKLASLENEQEKMKQANKLLRSKDIEVADEQLKSMGYDERTIYALRHPSYGSIGFQPWRLQNNNASIRTIKQRIKELEEAQSAVDKEYEAVIEGTDCVVHENTSINRLQLIFDGKPDYEVRSTLKHNGFRWSPSEGAWQRQLNDNSRWALKRIADEILEDEEPNEIAQDTDNEEPALDDTEVKQDATPIAENNYNEPEATPVNESDNRVRINVGNSYTAVPIDTSEIDNDFEAQKYVVIDTDSLMEELATSKSDITAYSAFIEAYTTHRGHLRDKLMAEPEFKDYLGKDFVIDGDTFYLEQADDCASWKRATGNIVVPVEGKTVIYPTWRETLRTQIQKQYPAGIVETAKQTSELAHQIGNVTKTAGTPNTAVPTPTITNSIKAHGE